MRRTFQRKTVIILLALVFSACHANLTPSQNLANIAGQIEQTADQMILAAKTLNVSSPQVMTDNRLVAIAMAGDKVGRLGADLANALMAYSSLKSAGGDTTAQATQIQTIIGTMTQAFSDMGKQIPNGTITTIDQSVTKILGMIAQIKAGIGL